MNLYKTIRFQAEIVLTRLALLIIPPLSRKALVRLARTLGWIACRCPSEARRVGQANLNLVFRDTLSPADKKKILQESFMTFSLMTLDTFWFMRNFKERVQTYVSFDPYMRELFHKKPRIFVTAHLGNWEVMGLSATVHGLPLGSVANPLANPRVDEIFNRFREQAGQKVIPREGAVRGILKTLHENGHVGILLDQNTRPDEGGMFVNFFGLPVPVSPVGAALALRANAEIVYAFCLPKPDGSYHVHIPDHNMPGLRPGENLEQATGRLTQEIADSTEQQIRRYPGAWLWMYKRWKYVPPGGNRGDFPFYSKALPDK